MAQKQAMVAIIQAANYDKIKEQVNENSIDVVKNRRIEKDKKVLQDGTIASGNTNVIALQQNHCGQQYAKCWQYRNDYAKGNGANADKVYTKSYPDFDTIFANSSSVRIFKFALSKSQSEPQRLCPFETCF